MDAVVAWLGLMGRSLDLWGNCSKIKEPFSSLDYCGEAGRAQLRHGSLKTIGARQPKTAKRPAQSTAERSANSTRSIVVRRLGGGQNCKPWNPGASGILDLDPFMPFLGKRHADSDEAMACGESTGHCHSIPRSPTPGDTEHKGFLYSHENKKCTLFRGQGTQQLSV